MVDVCIDDVLSELSDDDVREEFEARFGKAQAVGVQFDLAGEVHAELIGGRVHSALALLDSALAASRISDEDRQRQYQQTGRVQ